VQDNPKHKHTLDIRWQLSFWRWTFYFVFLTGRDRRGLTRRQVMAKRWAITIAITVFITISTLFGLLVLYLIKSAMGIDIFPHFSLGIWGWFKANFL
jgi:hypothetical protein